MRDLLNEKNICIQPHCDIGRIGKTREFIPEIKGMFSGFGAKEDVVVKPDSWAASTLANRHTK